MLVTTVRWNLLIENCDRPPAFLANSHAQLVSQLTHADKTSRKNPSSSMLSVFKNTRNGSFCSRATLLSRRRVMHRSRRSRRQRAMRVSSATIPRSWRSRMLSRLLRLTRTRYKARRVVRTGSYVSLAPTLVWLVSERNVRRRRLRRLRLRRNRMLLLYQTSLQLKQVMVWRKDGSICAS